MNEPPPSDPTVPDPFTLTDWSLTDSPSVAGDTLTLTILALPEPGSTPLIALEYRLGDGDWLLLPGGITLGPRTITVSALTLASITLRARNSVGPSVPSAPRVVLPSEGGEPVPVPLVALDGTQRLRTATAQGGSVAALTVAWYGAPDDTSAQRTLFGVFGRVSVRFFSGGQLFVEMLQGLSNTRVSWASTDGFNDSDLALWVVAYDGAAGTLSVTRNGVALPGSGTVLTGTVDLNRTHTVIGATAGSGSATSNPFVGMLGWVLVDDAIWTHAQLDELDVDGLADLDPIILHAAPASVWQAALNLGTGPGTWEAVGTVIDVGGSPAPANLRHGFGGDTTGGAGGVVVPITSTSTDPAVAGSLPWALAQHPGEPLVLVPVVEGNFNTGSTQYYVERSNITFDFRFAPGNGFWITGQRFGIRGSNIHMIQPLLLGNAPVDDGNAKTSIGLFSTDSGSNNLVDRIYIEGGLILYGRDETFSHVARGNGMASGSRITNVTVDGTIIGVPTGEGSAPHDFAHFVGDGVEGYTLTRSLLIHSRDRNPFVRSYARQIEIINNVIYNFRETGVHMMAAQGGVPVNGHVLGNVFRGGPYTGSTPRPFLANGSDGEVYADDNLLEDLPGGTQFLNYTSGSNGWTIRSTPYFNASDYEAVAASEVAAWIEANIGPRVHGGARHPLAATLVDDMVNGTGPSGATAHPGTLPVVTGATYPAHSGYVPNDYLAEHPADTSLSAVINDGSEWQGRQVWERVGAWLASAASA